MVSDQFAANEEGVQMQRKKPSRALDESGSLRHEELLDSEQAAKLLKIHPKTLQRYARNKYIRGFQIGSMWRFRASDIDQWIAQQAS